MRRIVYFIAALFLSQVALVVRAPAQYATAVCPTVKIECSSEMVCPGSPLTFTATVEGLPSGVTPQLNWKVSLGTISEGQGTQTITVAPEEIIGQSVTATVELVGFKSGCPLTASCTKQTAICCLPRKFDEYGNIAFEDEKARLDNVAMQAKMEPTSQVYLIAYAGRRARVGEAEAKAARAKKYLVEGNGLDAERVITIDGGYREDLTVEVWIRPANMGAPLASPTLQPSDVEIISQPVKRKPNARRNR